MKTILNINSCLYDKNGSQRKTDSVRKRDRKEILVNSNKTRIKIGHQHDHWMEVKEAFRVQTHAEV